MRAKLKRMDSEWPGEELCFSIIDNYVITCNHVRRFKPVASCWKRPFGYQKNMTTTFTSLSDIPAVSRSSIEATTSPASPTIILSSNVKLISPPSNFVENNYFWFNMRYLPLKCAFKNSLERIYSGEFLEPIRYSKHYQKLWYICTECLYNDQF